MRRAAPLLPAVVTFACVLGAGTLAAPRARTHTVTMAQMQFRPATLTVRQGDTVVWVNDDLVPHTATSDRRFDSGRIAAGDRWRWAARTRGSLTYVCTLHPTMTGQLRVE